MNSDTNKTSSELYTQLGNSPISQDTKTTLLETKSATESTKASSPIFDREEIRLKFENLLDSFNFKEEIASIDKRFSFAFKRKRIRREFVAISVALWNLALQCSFPEQFNEFYEYFLESSTQLGADKERILMQEKIASYVALLSEKKLEDFTPVAIHLSTFFSRKSDPKTLQLKISLALRRMYKVIFQYLI